MSQDSSFYPPARFPAAKDQIVRDRDGHIATRHLELHARALRGERAAIERLADELSQAVFRRLRRSSPRVPVDLIVDATHDAILAYTAQPLSFDIDRLVPLDRFVFGVAARMLRDRVRSEIRRSRRERDYAAQFLQLRAGSREDRATLQLAAREVQWILPFVCSDTELSAMRAWLNGCDNGAMAHFLGLLQLGRTEQQQAVKRFMARMIKRLQRHVKPKCSRSHPELPKKFNC